MADLLEAWRVVRPGFTSYGGYRWPFPGNWAHPAPSQREMTTGGTVPQFDGDGLCLAKTWRGAASAGIPAVVALLCEFDEADVLGEDADKIRVRKTWVKDVFDPQMLIRAGFCAGADLSEACLRQANLTGADLCETDLSGADLRRADLRGADLCGADLTGAHLSRADLYGVNLAEANLTGAFLYQANLCQADLRQANLCEADLFGADLREADLRGTDLTDVDLRGWERGPRVFARRVNGGGR